MAKAKQNHKAHPQTDGPAGDIPPVSPAQDGDMLGGTPGDEIPVAKEENRIEARFPIGDMLLEDMLREPDKLLGHMLREPDYQQILLWAEALGMAPEAVLTTLVYDGLDLKDGAMVGLVWDFDCLPLIPSTWVSGLVMEQLEFRGRWPDTDTALRPVLPSLWRLICEGIGLASIDLSSVPDLLFLACSGNVLSELNLSPVRKLLSLECAGNKLRWLDISPVTNLEVLNCSNNQLSMLDFSMSIEPIAFVYDKDVLLINPSPDLGFSQHGRRRSMNMQVHTQAGGPAGSAADTLPVSPAQNGEVLGGTPGEDIPVAKEEGRIEARFAIGDTLLREPDYQQILLWAEALGMAPEAVLTTLAAAEAWFPDEESIDFALEDGAMVCLVWDFERLPLIPTTWVPGLLIEQLVFSGRWPDVDTVFRPGPPTLRTLICKGIGLAFIDLSSVTELDWLECQENFLTKLELSAVPKLRLLNCHDNNLDALDISHLPELITLWCDEDVKPSSTSAISTSKP